MRRRRVMARFLSSGEWGMADTQGQFITQTARQLNSMSHDLKVAPSTMTAMSLQSLARKLLVLSPPRCPWLPTPGGR